MNRGNGLKRILNHSEIKNTRKNHLQATMATCHAGKNLREENGDGKAASLAFVK